MAFWGVEVKPGNPYVHRYDVDRGRLHVSQATLGNGSSAEKTILQCQVGDKKPIYLCSLLPEKLETCALNLEFEEEDEVTLSIIGPHSVHLSGFFYSNDEDQDNLEDDYESDPYEGDIMGTDSEDEDDSIDYDSEDGSEDDLDMYPTSQLRKSGVRIEEIVDDEKPTNQNDKSKRAKKLKTQASMSDDNVNNQQIVVKGGNNAPILESEDEDGFPVSGYGDKSDDSKSEAGPEEANDQRIDAETTKRNEKDGTNHAKKSKRKIDTVNQDGEHARENIEPLSTSVQPDTIIPNGEVKQKKKNKKRKAAEQTESSPENGIPNSTTEESPVAELGNDLKLPLEKKKEKKKKKKQSKEPESSTTPNAKEKGTDKKASALEKHEKEGAKPLQVRTFPNGLMIEELVMGKPDGKRASSGKKVSVRYIGKLKKSGKIFDSNTGNRPFKFRLGIGQVIKGWDVGVNGMRVGDKRRLTIPPAMGYGAKGVGAIPPNSWLVFDIELVEVN